MRGKSWIRDIVSHFFILLLLGVGLYYLYTEAGEIEALASMGWLKTVFIIAFSLYALMVLIFVRQVFSSVKLERFRPGNQESLNRLDRMRRFRLPDRFAQLQRHWPEARAELRQHFIGDKWIGDNDPPFD
ncbi:MAG TPA: hypothetical protein VFD19_01760, partial [Clostridia bacterium]|nr:hypothetical protein [Clostridia bacterium]